MIDNFYNIKVHLLQSVLYNTGVKRSLGVYTLKKYVWWDFQNQVLADILCVNRIWAIYKSFHFDY